MRHFEAILPMRFLVASILILTSCGENTPDEDLFIVNIENTWSVEGDPHRTFFFDSDKGEAAESEFGGSENLEDVGKFIQLAGVHVGREVTFVVARHDGGNLEVYRGRFENLNRMTVSSEFEHLTLTR